MASPIPTTFDTSSQPQDSFASHYDLDNPLQAMSSYSKLLHQHIKRQMEQVTSPNPRRSENSGSISSLSSESSVESQDSVGN
ncbi:hypothetical protein ACLMJK_001295 [Lecanora helva]